MTRAPGAERDERGRGERGRRQQLDVEPVGGLVLDAHVEPVDGGPAGVTETARRGAGNCW